MTGTPVIVWEDGRIKAIPPEELSHLETLPELPTPKPWATRVPATAFLQEVVASPRSRKATTDNCPAFQGWAVESPTFLLCRVLLPFPSRLREPLVSHTYTNLNFHLVFATKHRQRRIAPEMESRLWEYLAGIAKQHGLHPHQIGGVADHVHVALSCPPTITVSKIAQLIKGNSSKWIHETFEHLRDFAWQEGYGAFSVSRSSLPRVIAYIANQRAHHATQSFDEEFRLLLEKHGLVFDPRQTGDE